ncbi:MAG: glycosyltransferase family 1 protein, partial [Microbacteriaceae bacterium]
YLAELRDRAAASARLTLHDPVPYARLSATLNAHDVGIHLLPPVNFNNAMALPNKLFDYVQARLGVLIGPSPAMAEYVERYGFGRVAADFTVEALAREIEALSIASVVRYKAASDAAARELSSEAQVAFWDAAISRLGQPAAS